MADQKARKDAAKANQAEVDRSIDEWRASQGLPPIDRGKEAKRGNQ